ncbi:MAG: polyphosphate kinase 1 [Armatimonadaceae bacterium]
MANKDLELQNAASNGVPVEEAVPPMNGADLYINRELSWLEFNKRVLEEAQDTRYPLLERLKFLAIFGSNLDEFFMIRVSGLQVQRTAGVADPVADGLSPTVALDRIGRRVDDLLREARRTWEELRTLLVQEKIAVVPYKELRDTEKAYLRQFFNDEIFPILTPLAVDPGHPFPHISNLSLNLAIIVRDPVRGERFARMKVPGTLERLVPLPVAEDGERRFTWLEEVVTAHLETLFPGLDPEAAYPFRVTRNADIEIQEDEAEDLLETVQESLRERHFGFVTRLEVPPDMPERIADSLIRNLEMDPRNLVMVEGTMGFSSLMELTRLDRPELKFPPHVPRIPPPLETRESLFDVLARRDIFLHHPYDSFAPVADFIQTAAQDSHVRAIKQTLYRVGTNSPLVPALIAARDADTQVATLVELKARFDEENNIGWARQLEEAGVHVAYGLLKLKTHCKVLLVVRREPHGIRRYLHLGTGNYNATTARIYTDFGLMTSDPELGADASDLFNLLTGYSRQTEFRKMLVAPVNLRSEIRRRIERETAHAEAGNPARLIFKMNALVDPEMIDLLYVASQAGVKVDLIVRGICCLRPGLPGISENITVVSIVGRFLEHARAFYFENNGDPELYAGSADLMPRNLDRRVEVLFPIQDRAMRNHIVNDILLVQLADNVQARRLNGDGTWERVRQEGRKRRVDSQEILMQGNQSRRRRGRVNR